MWNIHEVKLYTHSIHKLINEELRTWGSKDISLGRASIISIYYANTQYKSSLTGVAAKLRHAVTSRLSSDSAVLFSNRANLISCPTSSASLKISCPTSSASLKISCSTASVWLVC